MVNIYFSVEINVNINLNRLFKKLYKATNKLLNKDNSRDVEVNIVSEQEITDINQTYRSKNTVTDVISFSFDETIASNTLLGEIYICYNQASKQAIEYNHSLKRELAFLFVHGLLHLYGYDHIHKEQEEQMFNLQENILKKCKIYRESK